MTTAQVVETSVTVNNNSPIQDYVHPDDQTQPFNFTCSFEVKTRAIHKNVAQTKIHQHIVVVNKINQSY